MIRLLTKLMRWSSTARLLVRFMLWLKARMRSTDVQPPDGTAWVYTGGLPDDSSVNELVGTMMVVGIGTYGAKALMRLLLLLEQSGRERLVGAILFIEHDAQSRQEFEQSLPAVFQQRVVYGSSTAFFGFGNRPGDWVMERIRVWGPEIAGATDEAIERYRRRPENKQTDPSLVLMYVSPGGHFPVGLPVVERLRERFNGSRIIACTVLPEFTDLRERYPAMKKAYEHRGVEGWMVIDNMGKDYVSADAVQADLIAGLAAASNRADLTAHLNNVFYQALPKEPGGILLFQFAWADVVAERYQDGVAEGYQLVTGDAPRFVVRKDLLARTILDVWHQIEENRGIWSVDMPRSSERVIYDCVLTNLVYADLRDVQDVVHAGRTMQAQDWLSADNGTHQSNGTRYGNGNGYGHSHGNGNSYGNGYGNGKDDAHKDGTLFGKSNYATIFAPIPATVDKEKPTCRVIVLRLAAMANSDAMLGTMVKAPERRYWKQAMVEERSVA